MGGITERRTAAGASNKTNFSSIFVTVPRKWGQQRWRQHKMNSCCLHTARICGGETLRNASRFPPKCRTVYVEIRSTTRAYFVLSSFI
uniref:Uncharacterized protein n=1 Tax=Anguilla anguilla TaxID=7936 RepID=A0A0E9QZZ2_ANGAN